MTPNMSCMDHMFLCWPQSKQQPILALPIGILQLVSATSLNPLFLLRPCPNFDDVNSPILLPGLNANEHSGEVEELCKRKARRTAISKHQGIMLIFNSIFNVLII